MRITLFATLVVFMACQSKKQPNSEKTTFYIGTYTQKEGHVDGKGDGIYQLTFDPATLVLKVTDTIKGMTNPSFVALSKDQNSLYAVNEIGPGGQAIGLFESYSLGVGSFGKKLASVRTEGFAPCQIAQNRQGALAVVCNYVGGVVSVYPLPLLPDTKPQIIQLPGVPKTSPRQENSHPHSAVFSADGHLVYLADLGTDRIMMYQVDEAGQKLTPAETPFFELPEGSGPRHMVLSPDGKILYVLCELSNTIAVLDISVQKALNLKQYISTLPAAFQGANNSADIHLSKDGKMLYSSNRGHNSIAVFRIKPDNTVESIGHVNTEGKTPRNFHLTNDGNWMLVANQDSGDIELFDLRKGDLPVWVKGLQVNTPVSVVEGY